MRRASAPHPPNSSAGGRARTTSPWPERIRKKSGGGQTRSKSATGRARRESDERDDPIRAGPRSRERHDGSAHDRPEIVAIDSGHLRGEHVEVGSGQRDGRSRFVTQICKPTWIPGRTPVHGDTKKVVSVEGVLEWRAAHFARPVTQGREQQGRRAGDPFLGLLSAARKNPGGIWSGVLADGVPLVAGSVGNSKGRAIEGLLLGLFLNFIGCVVIAAMPARRRARTN